MIKNKSKKKQKHDKYKRWKLGAIPVLLGILGCVLLCSSRSKSSQPAVATATAQAESPNQPQSVDPAHSVDASALAWPVKDLAFLQGPNPLASYHQPEPEVEQFVSMVENGEVEGSEGPSTMESVRQELESQPLRYHFESSGRSIVMLGDRLMKAGDTLVENVTLRDVKYGNLVLAIERNPETGGAVQ